MCTSCYPISGKKSASVLDWTVPSKISSQHEESCMSQPPIESISRCPNKPRGLEKTHACLHAELYGLEDLQNGVQCHLCHQLGDAIPSENQSFSKDIEFFFEIGLVQ